MVFAILLFCMLGSHIPMYVLSMILKYTLYNMSQVIKSSVILKYDQTLKLSLAEKPDLNM